MQAYQLGIAKFQNSGAKVFGISTDNTPSLKAFGEKLGLPFPLLSDFVDRKVSKDYGVLLPKYGVANRVTFVIDKEGKITYMESGGDAIKILGAGDACDRLDHRKANPP